MDILHPLSPVKKGQKDNLVMSFKSHGFGYANDLLAVMLRSGDCDSIYSTDACFEENSATLENVLEPDEKVF